MILTIITIHLDDFDGLISTYQSLKSILFTEEVEWIVIDGGSVTRSAEQSNVLHRVHELASVFVSEPDNGIYDAMNKGTRLANGEYILYLNAGDELHPQFRFKMFVESAQTEGPGMIWGIAEVRDRENRVYARKTRHPRWLRYGTAVCHQAIFFNRSVLGTDPYNTYLDIAADYDLVCCLYASEVSIMRIDTPVCIFNLVGKSGQDKRHTLRQESDIRRKHFRIPASVNGAMTELKYLIWQAGTLMPSFRRAWSRFF